MRRLASLSSRFGPEGGILAHGRMDNPRPEVVINLASLNEGLVPLQLTARAPIPRGAGL
jgi:hypothetical protein